MMTVAYFQDSILLVRQGLVILITFSPKRITVSVSISEYGNLCKSSKSHFILCLTSIVEPQYEAPAVNGIVIDGAAMVHTSYPEFSIKILGEYCEVQVAKKIKALANVLE